MTDPNYTHLALVIDRSGSMRRIKDDMEGGIKTFLAEQAKEPGELHVDVTTFDTIIEQPYLNVRVDDIKHELIVPRGGTALNDALGSAIATLGEQLAALPEGDRPGHVIVMVVTDGHENASHEYSLSTVREMVERQKKDFGWDFMFLGTGIDAFAASAGYGILRGETISFDPSSAGINSVVQAASAYTVSSRAGSRRDFTEDERAAAEQV